MSEKKGLTPVLYHRPKKKNQVKCKFKMKGKVTLLGNNIGEYLYDFQVGKLFLN